MQCIARGDIVSYHYANMPSQDPLFFPLQLATQSIA